MRFILIIIILSLVLITSGCISETGEFVINITRRNVTENITEAGIEEVPENITEPEEPEEAPPEEVNVTENVTEEEIDLCASVICDDSITTCPDGEIVTCENTCDNETGNCTACIPDCTGHEAVEEECTLECGACKILVEEECTCTTELYCDGNGICEPSIGEWPDGDDCKEFEGCDDKDECTQDVFNPNLQECTHVDICCKGAETIIQGATYDSGFLTLFVNNGGNVELNFDIFLSYDDGTIIEVDEDFIVKAGELETFTIGGVTSNLTEVSIQDKVCKGVQDFIGREFISGLEIVEPGDVNITHINETEEIVTLEGFNVDMTNWTLEDAGPNFIYQFPDDFIIDGIVQLHSIGDPADNNETDLFWGTKEGGPRTQPVWNNDHDNATLKDSEGTVSSTYGY